MGLKPRTKGTCKWLLDHKEYVTWQKQGGLLWIKGRAGCGKSAMMDFITSDEKTKTLRNGPLITSFFFHAGESDLHESTCGLYRAILHQIFVYDNALLSQFLEETNSRDRGSKGQFSTQAWEWHESVLRTQCSKALIELASKGKRVNVYVDALDENSEGDAKNLVRWFRDISMNTQHFVNFCFSSRPWLLAGVPNDLTICLEHENSGDVEIYLDDRMAQLSQSASAEYLGSVKQRLAERTGGIFRWLTCNIDEIEEMISLQQPAQSVLECVDVLPQSLSDVYAKAIDQIRSDRIEFAMIVFQWLTLARRPLPIDDLKHATCLSTSKAIQGIPQVQLSSFWVDNPLVFENKVMQLFRGFILKTAIPSIDNAIYEDEVENPTGLWDEDGVPGSSHTQQQTSYALQFDHESVVEFMKLRGLQTLQNRFFGSSVPLSIAQRQLWIAQDCLNYLLTDKVMQFANDRTFDDEQFAEEIKRRPTSVQQFDAPALALYAARYWCDHARAAELGDLPDIQWVKAMALPGHIRGAKPPTNGWGQILRMTFIALVDLSPPRVNMWNSLHAFATFGLHWAMKASLNRRKAATWSFGGFLQALYRTVGWNPVHGLDVTLQTPLFYAASKGHLQIVDLLIQEGATVDVQQPGSGFTPLHIAAEEGHVEVVKLLVAQRGRNVDYRDVDGHTPLSLAVQNNNLEVVKVLLPLSKLSIHSHSFRTERQIGLVGVYPVTPLFNAWYSGSTNLVELLLTSTKIEGNLQDEAGHSMMHHISKREFRGPACLEKARLLINSGKFDLNLRDKNEFTPLLYAMIRDLNILKILLDTDGVDCESEIPGLGTALILAVECGLESDVKVLVQSGKVNLSATAKRGHPALTWAITHGQASIVKLLLDAGQWAVAKEICGVDKILVAAKVSYLRTHDDAQCRILEMIEMYCERHESEKPDMAMLDWMAGRILVENNLLEKDSAQE